MLLIIVDYRQRLLLILTISKIDNLRKLSNADECKYSSRSIAVINLYLHYQKGYARFVPLGVQKLVTGAVLCITPKRCILVP